MSVEREVKLTVGPMFRVPDLSGVVEGATTSGNGAQRFVTSYYDTPDLRLARWGCSLRYRTGAGWTVKLPQPSDGVTIVRDELTFEGGPGRPPEEALDLVRACVRSSSTSLIVRLQTVRHRTGIDGPDGKPIAEVVDDEVSVLDGRRVAERFREVEVELAEGADESVLHAAVSRLEGAGAAVAEPVPKYVRAMQPASAEPAEVVVAPAGPDATTRETVRASIAAAAERMLRHDPGVRLGDDPESVHQARVATRRLRSDLRTYRSILDEEWTAELRDELGWMGAELGVVRDLDVLGERLRSHANQLADDEPGVRKILDRLHAAREAGREELLSAMRGPRYIALLDRVVAAAEVPAVLPEVAERPAIQVIGELMEPPWSHLAAACEALGPASPDEELHTARIRAKRARYAAESLTPVFGKSAARFAKRAATLQTVLGEHQDAVMAIAWLRGHAVGTTARVAFAAGELAGVEVGIQERSRAMWPAAWKDLSSKKVRFWR